VRDQRGSVLALMPAAVLVFIVLGAIAVDSSLAFLGERQASNLAAAVANDAATQGIDVQRYYATGELVIDPVRVEEVAALALATANLDHVEGLAIDTDVVGDVVVVRVTGSVRSLFGRVLPGGLELHEVAASAEATAERG
jgi:Flp pilus assembly protein TadG